MNNKLIKQLDKKTFKYLESLPKKAQMLFIEDLYETIKVNFKENIEIHIPKIAPENKSLFIDLVRVSRGFLDYTKNHQNTFYDEWPLELIRLRDSISYISSSLRIMMELEMLDDLEKAENRARDPNIKKQIYAEYLSKALID